MSKTVLRGGGELTLDQALSMFAKAMSAPPTYRITCTTCQDERVIQVHAPILVVTCPQCGAGPTTIVFDE